MVRTKYLVCLVAAGLVACGDDSTDKRDAAMKADAADSGAGRGGSGGPGTGGGAGAPGTGGLGASGGSLGAGGSGGWLDAATRLDVAGGIDGPRDVSVQPIDVPMGFDAGGPLDGGRDVGGAGGEAGRIDTAMDVSAVLACGPFANGGSPVDAAAAPHPTMSFFVSSSTSATGDLGGLAGADERCRTLAQTVGLPSAQWRAYLSVEHDPPGTGGPVNARDRIGAGPWNNARGELVAASVAALHARTGDASLFVDERGTLINGQWTGSPAPNEHDILTGSNPDGTVALGKTCADWTSSAGPGSGGVPDGGGGLVARVGHSDGIGPQCSTATSPTDYTSWNSSHDNAGCNNTVPRGGAGRIYCFKAN